MNLFISLLSEVFRAQVALVRLDVLVDEQVVLHTTLSREPLSAVTELAEQELARAFSQRV